MLESRHVPQHNNADKIQHNGEEEDEKRRIAAEVDLAVHRREKQKQPNVVENAACKAKALMRMLIVQ